MEQALKQFFFSCGADVCGIANIDRFSAAPAGFSPKDVFEACQSVVVFGKTLPKGLTKVDSRLIYGYYNSFVFQEIDALALKGANWCEAQFGAMAVPLPCNTPYDAWVQETLTGKGLISMKHAAVLAGLGQLGKSSLLLHPKYGTLLALGAILTDLDLRSDDLCPTLCIEGCTKCRDACPVHAIQDGRVSQQLCRPNAYGKTARGFDTVNCNRCRTVCPMNYGRPPVGNTQK